MQNRITPVTVLACLILLTPAGAPAHAQGQGDLRRENERLLTEAADLQRELEAAHARIAALEAQIEELNRMLRMPPSGPDDTPAAPAETPVSIDESVPHASPRALLAAMQTSYQAELGALPIGAAPSDAERTIFLKALDKWTKRTNRDLRASIVWHVRIHEWPGVGPSASAMRVIAVDPETDVALGDPFPVRLTPTLASRIRRLAERNGADAPFQLKGALVPRAIVNRQRDAVGPFDNPRFIGPFAEFNMTVQPTAVMDIPKERDAVTAEGS
jgi:hypothetical protein